MTLNKENTVLSNLKISPRGPRDCTLDDILALQRVLKSSDSLHESEDDHTENEVKDQQLISESPDELPIQVFTKTKNKKKKEKKQEAHTITTKAHTGKH